MKRIRATDKCKKEGWAKGTVLVSAAWQRPRRILDLKDKALAASVKLKTVSDNKFHSTTEFVSSFPPDVKSV
jgi:hypothetical protein